MATFACRDSAQFRSLAGPEDLERLRPRLAAWRSELASQTEYAETREALERLDQLLSPTAQALCAALPQTEEAWARQLRGELEGLAPSSRSAWDELLCHCDTARQSKPSHKWLQQADRLIATIGPDAFARVMAGTLGEIGKPGAQSEVI